MTGAVLGALLIYGLLCWGCAECLDPRLGQPRHKKVRGRE